MECQADFIKKHANRKPDEGYQNISGFGVYKYYSATYKTWNDARKSCMEDGGYLALFDTKEEAEVIHSHERTVLNICI